MSRTIKFRGFCKELNKWLYGCGVCKDEGDGNIKPRWWILVNMPYRKSHIDNFVIEEKSIGQFTGQHDKNEREIFEGHVLGGYPHGDVIVQWSDKYACFIVVDAEEGNDLGLLKNTIDDCDNELEIVGNQFEEEAISEQMPTLQRTNRL